MNSCSVEIFLCYPFHSSIFRRYIEVHVLIPNFIYSLIPSWFSATAKGTFLLLQALFRLVASFSKSNTYFTFFNYHVFMLTLYSQLLARFRTSFYSLFWWWFFVNHLLITMSFFQHFNPYKAANSFSHCSDSSCEFPSIHNAIYMVLREPEGIK